MAWALLSWGFFNHNLPKLKATRNNQFSWVWFLFDMVHEPHSAVNTNPTWCMQAVSFITRNDILIQSFFNVTPLRYHSLNPATFAVPAQGTHLFTGDQMGRHFIWKNAVVLRIMLKLLLWKCFAMVGPEQSSQLTNWSKSHHVFAQELPQQNCAK